MVAQFVDLGVTELLVKEVSSSPDHGRKVMLHLFELDEENVRVVTAVPETCSETFVVKVKGVIVKRYNLEERFSSVKLQCYIGIYILYILHTYTNNRFIKIN